MDSMHAREWKIPPLTPEKAYVLGAVGPGDGWIETKGVIGLKAKDLDFVEKFRDCLTKVYGACPKVRQTDGYYRVRFCSRYLIRNDILNYGALEHFKEGSERVPKQIKNAAPAIKRAYLQAFFDSQGWVYLHSAMYGKQKGVKTPRTSRRVEAVKNNLYVIQEIRQLLSDLNIYSYIRRKSEKGYRIAITGKIDLKLFKNQIGFSIARKRLKLDAIFSSYHRRSPYELNKLMPIIKKMREVGLGYPAIGRMLGINHITLWNKMNVSGLYTGPQNKGSKLYGG